MAEAGREDRGADEPREVEAGVGGVDGRADHEPEGPGIGRRVVERAVRGDGRVLDPARDRAGGGPGGGRQHGALEVARLRVGGRGEHEHARSPRVGRGADAVEGSDARIRRERDGVGAQRAVGCEPGGAVRVDRGADVAALGVGDHEEAGVARRGEHALEGGVPGGSVALEERDLRLDDAGSPRGRLDHAEAELLEAARVVGEAPGVEQRAVRVDAHAEVPVRAERAGQPRAERRGVGNRPAVRRRHLRASRAIA